MCLERSTSQGYGRRVGSISSSDEGCPNLSHADASGQTSRKTTHFVPNWPGIAWPARLTSSLACRASSAATLCCCLRLLPSKIVFSLACVVCSFAINLKSFYGRTNCLVNTRKPTLHGVKQEVKTTGFNFANGHNGTVAIESG